jgi:hypothetical protein
MVFNMRFCKSVNQLQIFDAWADMSPKRRRLLDKSWPGLFLQQILPVLPVASIARYFCDRMGRPTNDLRVYAGVLLLQQMLDMTDQEAVDALAFDIRWHYALDIPEESDRYKYMSARALFNVRIRAMADSKASEDIFDNVLDRLASVFDVLPADQRLDSVQVKSNMRRLGRAGLIGRTIRKFLVNLKRQYSNLYAECDLGMISGFLPEEKEKHVCFGMLKPTEAQKTLTQLAGILYYLTTRFSADKEVQRMNSYKLLERVLAEQCKVVEDQSTAVPKEPKDVSSDSLQNPSDPDAGYSGHKGQGFQVQVMETHAGGDAESDDTQLNLITHIQVDPACASDGDALIPAIEAAEGRGMKPESVTADTLYGSDDNYVQADKRGVELIAPTIGTPKKEEFNLSDFIIEPDGGIHSCPEGQAPLDIGKNGEYHTAYFDIVICKACLQKDNCCIKQGKQYGTVRYKDKTHRLAFRRQAEETDEFKNLYRMRAGVEATMSELDRKTGFKRHRYRGLPKIQFAARLKAAGLNILRAARAQNLTECPV